jgi:Protein of unknown function (DUF4231)
VSWSLFSDRQQPKLVTPQALRSVIESVKELEPYSDFMEKRWIGMVMWWDDRSRRARLKYFRLRAVVIAGGVSIPVMTTLSLLDGWHTPMAITIAIVGAIIAGCAAWEGIANYGETWREKRRAAELLKVEGWQFIQLCGKYEPADKTAVAKDAYALAYPRFAAEVEAMIAREVGEYLAVFDPALEEVKKAGRDALAAIDEKLKAGH